MAAKKGKSFVVSAPLIQVQLGDKVLQFYSGDVLPEGVSDEALEHLQSLDYVTEGDAPVGEPNAD